MKNIIARLKNVPTSIVKIDFDFNKDWILASSLVEESKRRLLLDIKSKMHEQISVLSLDDLEFKINEETPLQKQNKRCMKVDLKQILKDQANWKHPNFGIVADFIVGLGKNGVVNYSPTLEK